MDLVLISVTAVSLILAIAMSSVAWSLIRSDRERTAARVEALEALAFAEPDHAPPAAPAPRRVEERHTAVPAPVASLAPRPLVTPASATAAAPMASVAAVPATTNVDDSGAHHHWDFALRDAPAGVDDDGRLPEELRLDAAATQRVTTAGDMFGATVAPKPAGRLWLALAAVALVVAASLVTVSALRSPEIVAVVAASRQADAQAEATRPLELLSLRHAADPDGTFTVTGLVQNPVGGKALQNVEAVVYLFNETGQYFATGRAALDVPSVEPGEESPFVVHVANAASIGRYRVGFRQADGKVVAHVDHRGQLPTGTTGDVLGDSEPELAQPAGGMRPLGSGSTR